MMKSFGEFDVADNSKTCFRSEEARKVFISKRMAEMAYIAYGRSTKGKNFLSEPLPEWDALPEATREAWRMAACAIWRRVDKGSLRWPEDVDGHGREATT